MEAVNTLSETALLKDGRTLAIRSAVPEDAAAIVEYMCAVGGESDNLTFGAGEFDMSAEKEAEFIADLHKDGRSIMLAGFVGGELASVSALNCRGRLRNRHNADFSLTVREKFWGIGAGDAMLRAIINYARAHGDIINIHLGVVSGNDKAIRLYEKHGFQKIGDEKRSMRIGGAFVDADLMDLYL
ncbi:L-amino acid N-acyltransferase YncA [Sporobacter termitidis DSM 10068]|uniref:L-amino acid N-acyltransferase YncA n=1 Tax=Sporobacter termitidis DSM 10068 TaxID=1123282 RepID=A0A1M5XQN9_9FIRM|nr:GNAT family protein [Sporobacter termitidis]SHI02110.1 L-amino acid N-acyltransferase YncA [Sporobacter termitidis DSM 10068]